MLVRVLYTRLDANPEGFTYLRGGITYRAAFFAIVSYKIRTYLRGGIGKIEQFFKQFDLAFS